MYKLARRGNGDCRRLWNDFAYELPADARLVIADVESERAEAAKVTKGIDKRLAKAESAVTVTKGAKKVIKGAKPRITKAQVRKDMQRTPGGSCSTPTCR